MDTTNKIRVTLVNRYYPPDGSVTAESASDLTKELIHEGFEVNIVTAKANYEGGGASGEELGKKHYISAVYEGKNKLLRLAGSIIESKRLIRKAIETSPDIVIVMTSPPLLNYYASKYFKKKKLPWVYWSLDLFPEAFKANGLVKKYNPVYKNVLKGAYSYAPELILALGDLQAEYLKKKFQRDIPTEILPCGVFVNNTGSIQLSDRIPKWKKDPNKIYLGYIGNLGEAHSVDFLLSVIRNLDPSRHRLILVLYGSQAYKVIERLDTSQEAIQLMDYLPREELNHIDIHLASLKAEWMNICVPSKLVSAVHRSSCFIFQGPENSDSWQYLGSAGFLIKNEKDLDIQIKGLLNKLDMDLISEKKSEAALRAKEIENDVRSAYTGLVNFLKQKFS